MIRDAITKIEELAAKSHAVIVDNAVDGMKHLLVAGSLKPILPQVPEPIKAHTLGAVADFIESYRDAVTKDRPLLIHIESATRVSVMSELITPHMIRHDLLVVDAVVDVFPFGKWMPASEFIVFVQAMFEMDDAAHGVVRHASKIREEASRLTEDDGITQALTAKTGITTVGEIRIPNPVTLRPNRTFSEIEQPECDFVFRLKSGDEKQGPTAALFSAGGNRWQTTAMERISKFINGMLYDLDITDNIKIIS